NPQQKPRLYIYMGGEELRYRDRAQLLVAMATGVDTGRTLADRASDPYIQPGVRGPNAEAGARAAQRVNEFDLSRRERPKPVPKPSLQWEINEPGDQAAVRAAR